jgi:stress response protein YsnF
VESATAEQVRLAQDAFGEGDELFDTQEYEKAIERYRASYAIVASPNTALMIARSLRELGRLDEAHAQYETTVAEAERAAENNSAYEPTAKSARDELHALRSRVGLLTIHLGDVPATADVTVGGKAVDTLLLDSPVVVQPGKVVVEARTAAGERARVEANVAAGREAEVTLKLGEVTPEEPGVAKPEAKPTPSPPAPEPVSESPPAGSSSLKTYAYVAGGVGVIGVAGFAVFGLMNNSAYSDLESDCPDGHCSPDRSEDIDAGRRYQMLANISAIVGAVGLGAGVTLYYFGHQQENAMQARLGLGPGSVQISGRF